jgi:hypothetical protein
MAFATLLRTREEQTVAGNSSTKGFTNGFIPCDPAWVDDSPEGNKSFFDTSRDNEASKGNDLKRKKTIRRSRAGRGY